MRTTPLQTKIIAFITDHIEKNNMEEGDRLPSQNKLAIAAGVSVVSIREAVKTLEAKNILTVKNGKGIYVKNYPTNLLSTQLDFKKEKESILELIHIRKVLEKEVLSKLIKNATEDEIDELGKVTAELMRKYSLGLNQTEEDRLFHSLTYKYCHSDVLNTLISSIYDMLVKFQEYPLHMEDPFTETIPLHEKLFTAVKERKIKRAQAINNEILNQMIRDIMEV